MLVARPVSVCVQRDKRWTRVCFRLSGCLSKMSCSRRAIVLARARGWIQSVTEEIGHCIKAGVGPKHHICEPASPPQPRHNFTEVSSVFRLPAADRRTMTLTG